MPAENKIPLLYVDLTPNDDLPSRILRAYRDLSGMPVNMTDPKHNQFLKRQAARQQLLAKAIDTLARAEKFRLAAKKSGKPKGRPVQLERFKGQLAALHKAGWNGSKIHRHFNKSPGAPSLSWICLQIAKLKS